MDITGNYRFEHPQSAVWGILTHPDSIAAALPGVQTLTPIDGETLAWTALISLAFVAINAEFTGEVRMSELDAPSQFRLTVTSGTGESTLHGSALIALAPTDETPDHTHITYTGTAELTGKFASFPVAIVKSMVMMMVRQYFGALARQLEGMI
jgi:carbon monoxide dehydrogenase subunit G